jgi:hypothetical protein
MLSTGKAREAKCIEEHVVRTRFTVYRDTDAGF